MADPAEQPEQPPRPGATSYLKIEINDGVDPASIVSALDSTLGTTPGLKQHYAETDYVAVNAQGDTNPDADYILMKFDPANGIAARLTGTLQGGAISATRNAAFDAVLGGGGVAAGAALGGVSGWRKGAELARNAQAFDTPKEVMDHLKLAATTLTQAGVTSQEDTLQVSASSAAEFKAAQRFDKTPRENAANKTWER